MSARSSVTRQTSQESDANNNFGSTIVNGSAIQFVVPTMQHGSSVQQAPYNPQAAAAVQQHLQRMNASSNGGNAGMAYNQLRQHQQRPGAAPFVAASQMPVLSIPAGGYLLRHPQNGPHPFYTVGMDATQAAAQGALAAAAAAAPANVSTEAFYAAQGQYQTAQITSPPPTSNIPGSGYPNFVPFPGYPSQIPGYGQFAVINGPPGASVYGYTPQQQPPQPASNYNHQGGPMDYGVMAAGTVQSQVSSDVVSSGVPSSVAPAGMQQSQQSYQQYQSQQQEQRPPRPQREKKLLTFINPETNENVMDSLIKETEEQQQKHILSSTPDDQRQTASVGITDRKSSFAEKKPGASAVTMAGDVAVSQDEASERVNEYYNDFTKAVAGGTDFDTTDQPIVSAPSSTTTLSSENQYLQQQQQNRPGARTGLPEHAGLVAPLEFGGNNESTGVASGNKGVPDIIGESAFEFGWVASSDQAVDVVDSSPQAEPQLDTHRHAPSQERQSVPKEDVTEDIQSEQDQSIVPAPSEELPPESISFGQPQDVILALEAQVQVFTKSPDDDFVSEVQPVDQFTVPVPLVDTEDVDVSETKEVDNELAEPESTVSDAETTSEKSKLEGVGDELLSLLADLKRLEDTTGGRRYSHSFMQLAAKLPASKIKPTFNTDRWPPENLDAVFNLQKAPPLQSRGSSSSSYSFRPAPMGGGVDFSTSWMKPSSPMGPPGRKAYPGRSSDTTGARRGGMRNTGRGSMMKPQQIFIPVPMADVQLSTSENAWKPGFKAEVNDPPEKTETEKLFKEIRGLLNKITPQTFGDLSKEFLTMEPRMNTKERAEGVVEIVFQKAVDEPEFCKMYSELYDLMTRHQLARHGGATKTASTSANKETNFRYILLSKCQTEFEKEKRLDAFVQERQEAINAAETPEKKQKLKDELSEYLMKEKRQTLGHMRFIGELYLKNMLTSKIMHLCVNVLLKKSADDDESLECLCKLMSTIGQKIEADQKCDFHPQILEYYKKLEQMLQGPRLTSRYRFMILDLFDLRKSNWQPRRKGQGPKTLSQIHKEAEDEKIQQKLELDMHERNKQQQQQMLGLESSPTRGSQRKGRRPDLPSRGSTGTPDRYEYENRGPRASMGRDHGRQAQQHQESVSKVKQPALSQHFDQSSVKLGPSRSSWSKGAGAATPSAPMIGSATLPRSAVQDFKLSNRFNQLGSDECFSAGSASSSRESSQTRYDERKLRANMAPPSIEVEKPTDDTSPAARSQQDQQESVPTFDEDSLRRYGSGMIDELVCNGDYNEAVRLMQERSSAADKVLEFAFNHVMEKKEEHRKVLGRLIGRIFGLDNMASSITKGFALFVRNAIDDDIAQDVPKIWANTGRILAVSLLASESASPDRRLTLSEFRDAFREAGDKVGAELLAQTLLAVKEESLQEEKAMEVYRSIEDKLLTDFGFSNNEVVAGKLERHGLDFLLTLPPTNSAGAAEPEEPPKSAAVTGTNEEDGVSSATDRHTPPSTPVSFPFGVPSSPNTQSGLHIPKMHSDLDQEIAELRQSVQTYERSDVRPLVQFLQNTRRFEGEIDDNSLAILGALIESMCSRVIVGGELDDSYVVNEAELDNFCEVLSPFFKSKPESEAKKLEFRTLDTLAGISQNLNCPKGLLVNILSTLKSKEVIRTEGLLEWWHSGEQSHPGMIRSSGEVKAFFKDLTDPTSDQGSESD